MTIGNLDEKVDERVLYELMVQAGPLLHIFIPRDKDSQRHKGYGFAEYTSVRSALYAVQLFTGLVTLHDKSLRFAISGQDKTPECKKTITVNHLNDNGAIQPKPPMSNLSEGKLPLPRPTRNCPSMSANIDFCGRLMTKHDLSYDTRVQHRRSDLASVGESGLRSQNRAQTVRLWL